jgi:hypothetical protein
MKITSASAARAAITPAAVAALDCEVIARCQGVGVVGPQDPFAVGQRPLVQGDRLGRPCIPEL